MDKYFVCLLLCFVQRLSVNGQMLVSHKEGVIITSSSQHVPNSTWNIDHVVDSKIAIIADKCNCCGATSNDMSPWYKLDLGDEYKIQRIHVIGRQDSWHNLYKMEIQLGTTEADGTVLQSVDTNDMTLRELNYTLPSPELARFITLTLRNITDHFLICELYVYAACSWGSYGLNCISRCGICEHYDTCNNVNGMCTSCVNGYNLPECKECIAGRYGFSCVEACGHCNNNDTCDKINGYCPNGCAVGYESETCTKDCSFGTYGLNCSNTCGACKGNTTCNNVDGTCTACVTGYIGSLCKECTDDRYGPTCSDECGHCNNSERCDKNNGDCPHGCSAGYQGSTCKEECDDGTYGLDCQETCGHCFNNGPCNKIHGNCVTCAAGYKGKSCLIECQTGTYGFNCIHNCGRCLDGDVCDIYTGECPRGCNDGYKGSQCSQEMNRDAVPCSDNTFISIPVFIGSMFAVIVINTTSVYLWMRYRNRLHKKTQTAVKNADTSIELPNIPSNYDTLEFDNPDEESRYTELNKRS